MRWIEEITADFRSLDVNKTRLRRFAGLVASVFFAIGGYIWWETGGEWNAALTFLAAGYAWFLMSGGLFPALLRPLYRVWMGLSLILGWFVSRIILIFLFYVILTPVGLIARLVGKRFMDITSEPKAETYWKPVSKSETNFKKMF